MMLAWYQRSVRTTITLERDVAAKLSERVRKTGASFKQTVNDLLREGLIATEQRDDLPPFKVEPLAMGPLRKGLSYDNLEEFLDQLEGPERKW